MKALFATLLTLTLMPQLIRAADPEPKKLPAPPLKELIPAPIDATDKAKLDRWIFVYENAVTIDDLIKPIAVMFAFAYKYKLKLSDDEKDAIFKDYVERARPNNRDVTELELITALVLRGATEKVIKPVVAEADAILYSITAACERLVSKRYYSLAGVEQIQRVFNTFSSELLEEVNRTGKASKISTEKIMLLARLVRRSLYIGNGYGRMLGDHMSFAREQCDELLREKAEEVPPNPPAKL